MNNGRIKKIKDAVQFAPIAIMLGIFFLLSPENASNLAGWLGRKIGPKLGASKKARANLKMALPGKTDDEYNDIITGMWDNLGRVMAEYQNLEYFAPDVELAGVDHLKKALEENAQIVFWSGHLGNWEIVAPTLLHYDIPMDIVYRPPNNQFSDRVLDRLRSMNGKLVTIPKSKTGTRMLVDRMQEGDCIMMLIDQKYNEGLAVPFFGLPAMTSSSFVQLSQKYDCPLVPFRLERIEGPKFRLTFFEAIETIDPTGEKRPAEDVIAEAHALLESWIIDRPEQWLWLHRRWIDQNNPGKKAAAKMEQARLKNAPRPPADQTPPAA